MRKLGIILSSYDCEEYVEPCLKEWSKFDFPIACSSFRFEGFEKKDNFQNIEALKKFIPSEALFYDDAISLYEHNARNISLEYLKKQDVDTFLVLDIDEMYLKKDIDNLLNFINGEEFSWVAWARIHFKNYIFDGSSWVDGFCPPRLFKSKYQDCIIDKFYWDNDILYSRRANKPLVVDYRSMSHITVPRNQLHVKHLTWINSQRSKDKIEYQEKHFGLCSYRWNNEEGCVEINPKYYESNSMQPYPIINKDNDA